MVKDPTWGLEFGGKIELYTRGRAQDSKNGLYSKGLELNRMRDVMLAYGTTKMRRLRLCAQGLHSRWLKRSLSRDVALAEVVLTRAVHPRACILHHYILVPRAAKTMSAAAEFHQNSMNYRNTTISSLVLLGKTVNTKASSETYSIHLSNAWILKILMRF